VKSRFRIIISSLLLLGCNIKENDLKRDLFHGMWKMDKHEVLDSATRRWLVDSTRIGITGYVVYDGKGHMAVQQLKMPGDSSENNIDIVYFSTYAIDEVEKAIGHTKLTSSFDDVGSTVKRNFEFNGDTLILTPQEAEGKLRIRWIRSNP
jgi:hypothetical protein